jgi:hypothetical protein
MTRNRKIETVDADEFGLATMAVGLQPIGSAGEVASSKPCDLARKCHPVRKPK